MQKLHDSHIHLDILVEKLGLLQDIGDIDISNLKSLDKTNKLEIKNKVQELLSEHELALQATVSTKNFEAVYELFYDIDKVYFLYGAHPEIVDETFNLNNFLDYQGKFLAEHGILPKVLGFGECGLDYYYTKDREIQKTQRKLFQSQIDLCIKYNKPLIIHSRDAFEDTLDILRANQEIYGKFWVHCFTGDKDILRQVLDIGGKVAYGGILTFGKNADYLRESLKYTPNDSFLVETDLPFLTPAPHRGQLCLPQYVSFVAKKIAKIKEIKEMEVWEYARKNLNSMVF